MYLIFAPYLSAIVLAVTLAIIFNPLYRTIHRLMPKFSGFASFITVLLAIIFILIPLIFFGFQIFKEAQGLYTNIVSGQSTSVISFFNTRLNEIAPWLNFDIKQSAEQLIASIVGNLVSVFSQLSSVAIILILSLFTFYYLLKDGNYFKEAFIKASPLSLENSNKIISKLILTCRAVISGSLSIALIQGICIGLGFWIFGIENPVLWGSISIILSLIPVIGAAFVIIPGIISLALTGDTLSAVGFGIWCFALAGGADNLLRPLLIKKNINIHPLLVLFSVLGGLYTFGITGFLLGPLALSFFLTLVEIYPIIISNQD